MLSVLVLSRLLSRFSKAVHLNKQAVGGASFTSRAVGAARSALYSGAHTRWAQNVFHFTHCTG